MNSKSHEIARQIRQQFFVFRNGLLADNLRDKGDTHRMIFGLNLIQIIDIARSFEKDAEVATELWNSKDTRECRLIAPILYPVDSFSLETALKWIEETENKEIADNLCHKLLRDTPFAPDLCTSLAQGSTMQKYIALRLALNLLIIGKTIDNDYMRIFAQEEIKNNTTNIAIARSVINELDELLDAINS